MFNSTKLYRPGKKAIPVTRVRGSFGLDNTNYVESITLKLPYPPSANRIWRVGAGGQVYKSPEYTDWQTMARFGLSGQPKGRVRGAYEMMIAVRRPEGRRHIDLDNNAKAISDFLQSIGVIENDSLCERLEIKWARQDADVIVTVQTANAGVA